MRVFLQEFMQALRAIGKRPAFSALLIGVLAAGLSCGVFMLTMINGFVLRPLPFASPEQLMYAGVHKAGEYGLSPIRDVDLAGMQRHMNTVADVAAVARATMNLSDLDRPERYNGAFASKNLFRVLRVAPILGRDFSRADVRHGAPAVAILSFDLWQARYGSDAAIIGRTIRIDAKPVTVIGVMPRDFSYPIRETVWMAAARVDESRLDYHAYRMVIRRHADASDAAVGASFENWFADAAHAEPMRFRGLSPGIEPLEYLTTDQATRAMLGAMLAAVLTVLLVTCANVANLMLVSLASRRQELAVRMALGASRGRLTLQLLAQTLLLSLAATVIALLATSIAVTWAQALLRQSEFSPLWLHFSIDSNVLLMALVMAVFTAVVTGVLPALHASRGARVAAMRDNSRSIADGAFARISRWLVVGEIALSCALLISTATLVRGVVDLQRADLGIDPTHLLSARIVLPEGAYPHATDQLRFYENLTEHLRADPGVVEATAATVLPGTYYNDSRDIAPEGFSDASDKYPQTKFGAVDDHFLSAYGVQLVEGRFFDSRDQAQSIPVAVVDARFSARFGDGKSLVGRRFRLDPSDPAGSMVNIVGTIGTLKLDAPGDLPEEPTLLIPLRQGPFRIASIAVRTRGEGPAFAPALNRILFDVDQDTPAFWVRDYAAVIRSVTLDEQMTTQIFTVFGIVTLLLATVGLYAVLAFSVRQRTREIGVRRAVGALGITLLRQIFARIGWQLLVGLGFGVVAGIAFAHLLSETLPSIHAHDCVTVICTVILLGFAAILAAIVPARRALRVDPIIALRHD